MTHHRPRPTLGELEVVLGVTAAVTVALNPEQQDVGIVDESITNRNEDLERTLHNIGAVGHEEDLLENNNLLPSDDGPDVVRATVLIVEAIHVFDLIGAHVDLIGNAVLVVVEVRAAVIVFKTVDVLGGVRT